MTAASLYIDYNNRLAKDIQPIFIKCVKPENVVHVFHKYSDKVLTKVDIENVEAESNSKGPIEGAKMLFRRLVLYQDWFSVLGKVLIDPDIKSRHIADGMLEVTESTKQWYESEKAKLQTSSSSERGNDNVQPKQVTTHSIGGQVLSQVETRSTPIESSSEQYETDSAEMKSGNGVSSQLGEMATAHSRSSSQAGTSGHTVEASGKTELMSAAACGDKELLMSLLKNTSDIDASDQKGRTALMYAAGKCQTECLEQLICHRCDVNKADVDGCTALMVATDRGDDKCVELLIYERAKVDAANMSGRTALMIAATKGYAKCIKMLLLAGCDTDKRHRDGKTALMYAARQGHYDCVELLIDSHCDFDASDGTGLTALIYAALNGHFNCVHLLVDGGANVNKSDTTGNSALMWAIVCKHTECVRLLLANNADVNSVNSCGQSPLTVANSTECHELVRLIEKATRRST